jgi:hypothetical protein
MPDDAPDLTIVAAPDPVDLFDEPAVVRRQTGVQTVTLDEALQA